MNSTTVLLAQTTDVFAGKGTTMQRDAKIAQMGIIRETVLASRATVTKTVLQRTLAIIKVSVPARRASLARNAISAVRPDSISTARSVQVRLIPQLRSWCL